MFTYFEQKFTRSSRGKDPDSIDLRSQLVAASRWGVGRDNALIFHAARRNFLETNKTKIPVFVGAHYKHGRIQGTGIDLLYPRRSFRCCYMSVLLVISYTCELDPTTSARVQR